MSSVGSVLTEGNVFENVNSDKFQKFIFANDVSANT